jgi:uncharacterized protein with PIN domain
MLKGLTRWLRAAGYDAWWAYDLEDEALIEVSRTQNRILLTSDSGLMKQPPIVSNAVSALFVPRELNVSGQVEFVFQHYGLKRRPPRCMKCGGGLAWIPKASVRTEAPPRTYCWLDDFYRCLRCGQLFWKGTHWNNILDKLDSLIEH